MIAVLVLVAAVGGSDGGSAPVYGPANCELVPGPEGWGICTNADGSRDWSGPYSKGHAPAGAVPFTTAEASAGSDDNGSVTFRDQAGSVLTTPAYCPESIIELYGPYDCKPGRGAESFTLYLANGRLIFVATQAGRTYRFVLRPDSDVATPGPLPRKK